LIREIAKIEKITVADEDIDKQIKEMKEYYKSVSDKEPRAKDALKHADSPEYRAYVYNVINSRQVIDKLSEWNISK
jgi:FKBP-type peptidyl-prolyl cis-trans isomerase (trigger factor)